MAETKRVNDLYKISAPTIVLDGNLTVTGSTTSVETINSTINDNTIVLNNGESGAGVTAGRAGIDIDRGTSDTASISYFEADDVFEFKIGSSYSIVRGGEPVGVNDFTTKFYVDGQIDLVSPAGPLNSLQFNLNDISFGGSANLTWDGTTLAAQDVAITTGSISVSTVNSNLELAANGTGKLYFRSALRIENRVSDPTSDSGSNVLFAKTVGNAGSGVYFTNTTATDELVSRSKAILFGLIF